MWLRVSGFGVMVRFLLGSGSGVLGVLLSSGMLVLGINHQLSIKAYAAHLPG